MGKAKSIPGQITAYLKTRHKNPEIDEIQLFFRPLKDKNGSVTDWVLVGKQVCTKAECEALYGSCSSCRSNATKEADKKMAEAELEKKANNSGLILAKSQLVVPKGLEETSG